jgi:hypothetical protein
MSASAPTLCLSFQLFGFLWNWCLFGVLLVQVCEHPLVSCNTCQVVYRTVKTCIATTSPKIRNFSSYSACQLFLDLHLSPSDGSYIVYGVFFLETLQTALSGADLYYWFVSGYGNLRHLTSTHLTPVDVLILGSFVSLSVQFFFAYRIWVLSLKKLWWYCLIICLVSPSKMCCYSVLFFVAVLHCCSSSFVHPGYLCERR